MYRRSKPIRKSTRKSTRKLNRRSLASPTRGWKASSPKRISSRRKHISKCGTSCYLLPSKLKFPICDSRCKVSCKGSVAAYVRAKQWKYPTVAKKAQSIINRMSCTKKSRKRH